MDTGGGAVSTRLSLKGNEPPITLRGTSMRFLDVIDDVCRQAGLFWWLDTKCLVVAGKDAYERSKSRPK